MAQHRWTKRTLAELTRFDLLVVAGGGVQCNDGPAIDRFPFTPEDRARVQVYLSAWDDPRHEQRVSATIDV